MCVHTYVSYICTLYAHQVCEGKVIHMFHPRELMALVVGNSVLDWSLMEEVCVCVCDCVCVCV